MSNITYIYHLPYMQRVKLCEILNENNDWEELAGTWMKYDDVTIQCLQTERNPADKLLTLWGTHNHIITELFVLLCQMKHYEAMVPLAPFVENKFHRLLYHKDGSLRKSLYRQRNKSVWCKSIGMQALCQLKVTETQSTSVTKAIWHNSNDLINAFPKRENTLPVVAYSELNIATNGWNQINLLGTGGSASVYKGIWKNTDVAIKKIAQKTKNSDKYHISQFRQAIKEINILNSYPHENILPLFAYSVDGKVPCLVYQLMINGSLWDRLFLKENTEPLTWLQRHEIALGTARGLQYLHTITKKSLVHGDIKSANIMLDKYFTPRIGDFGLAREISNDDMQVNKIQGTKPYLPKDFFHSKKLCTLVDTYSYGVVLFELATGLPAYNNVHPKKKLLRDLIDSWGNDELPPLIDKKAGDKNKQVFANFIFMGRWCTNNSVQRRPEMEIVYNKLKEL